MIDNLDISEIHAQQNESNVSKQSSLRHLQEQTSNYNQSSGMTFQTQQQKQNPSSNILPINQTRKILQNTTNGSFTNNTIQTPNGLNAPLPPQYKRDNISSSKRGRQPIFGNQQSNSLSRNQSPASNTLVQNNLSSGNINPNMMRTSPNIVFNQTLGQNQNKTDSFHTCLDQTNNISANQNQGSLLFRKSKESFDNNDLKGTFANTQSPYLNIEKNDTESFMSVTSNQNVPTNVQNINSNITSITRRIFSNTVPIQANSPLQIQQEALNSPAVQTIESKPFVLDSDRQTTDLKGDMMKYAKDYFSQITQDVQKNNSQDIFELFYNIPSIIKKIQIK